MFSRMHATGFIKDVIYKAHLAEPLIACGLTDFDINNAKPYGLLHEADAQVAFSKWAFRRVFHAVEKRFIVCRPNRS